MARRLVPEEFAPLLFRRLHCAVDLVVVAGDVPAAHRAAFLNEPLGPQSWFAVVLLTLGICLMSIERKLST